MVISIVKLNGEAIQGGIGAHDCSVEHNGRV